ncbi:hypothetical protein MA47_09775 [Corynebacterium auriscanis]|uniref:Uncharacterized protein n=1 Tax=Corynebacterium auriscanis TaxID=99807 RepID=A0A0A2DJR4_9CORY|nr:hypothetical protein MA47_09775 [Corynebacterium auriscanis]
MSTNHKHPLQRAVDLMGAALTAYTPITNDSSRPFLVYLAEVLYDAGLLAPDLPKPESPGDSDITEWLPLEPSWDKPNVWITPGGRIMTQNVDPGNYTPHEARKVALALLAAANHAEQGQQ